MVVEELAKTVLDELREIVKTETVIGDPIQVKDTTVIPVSKVSVGFAAGGGEGDKGGTKKGGGTGTGGGASVEPIGFIIIKGEKVKLLSFQKKGGDFDKLIKMVPDIVSFFKRDKKDKKEKKEEKGKSEEK